MGQRLGHARLFPFVSSSFFPGMRLSMFHAPFFQRGLHEGLLYSLSLKEEGLTFGRGWMNPGDEIVYEFRRGDDLYPP